jgi:hypothetical protein
MIAEARGCRDFQKERSKELRPCGKYWSVQNERALKHSNFNFKKKKLKPEFYAQRWWLHPA